MGVDGKTLLFGVVGNPVEHSLSPVFQNLAFELTGINGVYLPLKLPKENFEEAFKGLTLLENFKGCNVTVPFKERVLKFADFLSPEVRDIGSANTVKKGEKGLELYNTDWIGFLRSLEELTYPEGKTALVLGAGGTAKAVVYALKRIGAKVSVWNRTPQKALLLAKSFGVEVEENLSNAGGYDIIVNTTSVGLKEDDPPLFDYSLIKPSQVVYDVIYRETPLIKAARQKGAKAENGLKMLLYQGIESFKIWTGKTPPVEPLWKALKEAFERKNS
jgi:shikimate dehydrogenase